MISQLFLSLAKILSNRSEKKLICMYHSNYKYMYMGLKNVQYKFSKKKKINIPSGALFRIPAKHLADSDLV